MSSRHSTASDSIKKVLFELVDRALQEPGPVREALIRASSSTSNPSLHPDRLSSVGDVRPWHGAQFWKRDAKRKDRTTGRVTRVFGHALYEATVESDPQDEYIERVTLQIGPGWPVEDRPALIDLELV